MKKNSIKILFSLLIVSLFTACSFKQNILNINHYSIGFSSNNQVSKNSIKSIYIEKPEVNKSFNTNAILYSKKAYLFEEYAKNRWINQPTYMIHDNLVQWFEKSNLFKFVLQKKSNVDFDYSLKTNISTLYHKIEDNKSFAILKIRFDLVSGKKFIKTYSYDKKILCETTNAYGFVLAINKAFDEVLTDLTSQLNSEVKGSVKN